MDVADDEAVPESLHGIAEDVAGDGLDDIFCEFWTIAFDALPFLCGADAEVGDGFTAEAVFIDPGLDVGELPAGRERDEEHAALAGESDAFNLLRNPLRDRGFDGAVDIPPELHDVRIRGAPGIHQRLQFIFREAHFKCAHGF